MISARDFGLDVVKSSGGEELVVCPFHADHSPSAWFNPVKGLFYCTVCDLGLNINQLAKRLNVDVSVFQEESEFIPEYNLVQEEELCDLGSATYNDYFRQRGISEETIKKYGVRWLEYPYPAAVLPVTNLKGQVKGAVYRYRNPEQVGTRYKKFGASYPVWPMHLIQNYSPQETTVIVTEGAWSAMRIRDYFSLATVDYPVLALLGAKANKDIVQSLFPFRVFYLYDGDMAGRRACRKMRELSPLTESFVLSKSPDDMNKNEIGQMLTALFERI